jgi:hypothetical protein
MVWGIDLAFTWRNWGKPREASVRTVRLRTRFQAARNVGHPHFSLSADPVINIHVTKTVPTTWDHNSAPRDAYRLQDRDWQLDLMRREWQCLMLCWVTCGSSLKTAIYNEVTHLHVMKHLSQLSRFNPFNYEAHLYILIFKTTLYTAKIIKIVSITNINLLTLLMEILTFYFQSHTKPTNTVVGKTQRYWMLK